MSRHRSLDLQRSQYVPTARPTYGVGHQQRQYLNNCAALFCGQCKEFVQPCVCIAMQLRQVAVVPSAQPVPQPMPKTPLTGLCNAVAGGAWHLLNVTVHSPWEGTMWLVCWATCLYDQASWLLRCTAITSHGWSPKFFPWIQACYCLRLAHAARPSCTCTRRRLYSTACIGVMMHQLYM